MVGYGSMRKSDLTGSVTSVKLDESQADRSSTLDQLLVGKAAGVQVVSNSASPDAGVSIRIRGLSSLQSGSEPLYVVDGIIMSEAGSAAMLKGTANVPGQNQHMVLEKSLILKNMSYQRLIFVY